MAGGAFESNTRTIAGMLTGLPCWRTTGILISSMDQFTYELIRRRRPELKMESWLWLTNTERHRMKRIRPDQLVARVTAGKLSNSESSILKYRAKRHINCHDPVPF